jgi:uncharacterized protein (TIGR02391 family)
VSSAPSGSWWSTVARRIAADLVEFSEPGRTAAHLTPGSGLSASDGLLEEYDQRILDVDLRAASRSRFVSSHYADAVEAGVKALNECVRMKSGRTEDGDALMTVAFSPNAPLLKINKGRTKSDESEQRGHMQLCQGVVGAWRNPRAHFLVDDSPSRALMMLETIDALMTTTKSATRTRRRRKP